MRLFLPSISVVMKTFYFFANYMFSSPFYPEYDSSRSYPFYPEYDSSRSLHLARLPRTLTFWNPIGWLTPNDVSISGSLGNPYFQPISAVLWVFAVQSEHPQAKVKSKMASSRKDR